MNVRDETAGRAGPWPLAEGRVGGDPFTRPGTTPTGGRAPAILEIPGYRIEGTISEGAMGTVFRARQLSVDRVVAIKVLDDALAHDGDFVRRFWREVLIAARLSHPNVIATIDAGEVDGDPFLVMEHVEGETVQDALDRRGPFEEREAIRVVREVAEALRGALRRGLIHRDVKPSNVILTRDGGVKLADLGLARPTADEPWVLAEAGMAVGTPEYISPEQVRGQVDVDIRSDLYSLGATLYHMLTGRVPFGGSTVAEALRRHVDPRFSPTPPDDLNPRLSSGVAAVIGKLLARNREDRYRGPDDLILDLECLLRGDRPRIAEPAPEALASLAVGEAVAMPRAVEADATPVPEDASASGIADEDRGLAVLVAVPACLLAISMTVTVALLVAR